MCIKNLNSCNAEYRGKYVKEGQGYIKEHKHYQSELQQLRVDIAAKTLKIKELNKVCVSNNILVKESKRISNENKELKKEVESLKKQLNKSKILMEKQYRGYIIIR